MRFGITVQEHWKGNPFWVEDGQIELRAQQRWEIKNVQIHQLAWLCGFLPSDIVRQKWRHWMIGVSRMERC